MPLTKTAAQTLTVNLLRNSEQRPIQVDVFNGIDTQIAEYGTFSFADTSNEVVPKRIICVFTSMVLMSVSVWILSENGNYRMDEDVTLGDKGVSIVTKIQADGSEKRFDIPTT